MRSRAGTCASVLWNVACRSMLPVASKASQKEAKHIKQLLACKPGRCVYCNARATSMDHFRPILDGKGFPTGYGSDPWNLVPACSTCNSSKGNKHWMLFMYSRTPQSPASRNVKNLHGRVKALKRFEAAGQSRTRRVVFTNQDFAHARQAVRKYAEICWSEVSKCFFKPLPPVGMVFTGRSALHNSGVHLPKRSWYVIRADGSLASLCLGHQAIVLDKPPFIGIACASSKIRKALEQSVVLGKPVLVTRSWRMCESSAHAPAKQNTYVFAGQFLVLRPQHKTAKQIAGMELFRYVLACTQTC
jgi:hypothetical protein